jgi:hypothetical protein
VLATVVLSANSFAAGRLLERAHLALSHVDRDAQHVAVREQDDPFGKRRLIALLGANADGTAGSRHDLNGGRQRLA